MSQSVRRAALLPAASLLLATGCTGPGSDASSAATTLPASVVALQAEYTSPSGTFQLSDVPAVLAALSADTQTPFNLPLPLACDPSMGSCCTSGSVTQTDSPPSAGAIEGTTTFQGCSFFAADPSFPGGTGTVSVTGTVTFVRFLGADAGLAAIYQGTVSETGLPDGGTRSLSANFAAGRQGPMTFDVAIASGSVIVTPRTWSEAAGGGFLLQDRPGSWECTVDTNLGVGNCISVEGDRPLIDWVSAVDGGVSAFVFDGGLGPGDAGGE